VTSVIGGLGARGLSVAELARQKDLDIRPTHSCWLSQAIADNQGSFGFKRLIVYEPEPTIEPPERVGDVFRALQWLIAVRPEIRSVALPVLAAGDMGYPVELMLSTILEAAKPWMELGIGLNRLLIVTRSQESSAVAQRVFAGIKADYTRPAAPTTANSDFDVFVSYSHKNSESADQFITLLKEQRPNLRVFRDTDQLQVGMAWQSEIWDRLERSRYVVALLSPDYLLSKPCQDEFGMARLQGQRTDRPMLQPIYLHSAELPTHIVFFQYIDAREGGPDKLREAAAEVAGLFARV
jgi:hypothetical protein